MNGFVFRTVILERAADVRNKADQEHITDKQGDLQETAEQCIPYRPDAGTLQKGFKTGRKSHKNTEGQGNGKNDRKSHYDFFNTFSPSTR